MCKQVTMKELDSIISLVDVNLPSLQMVDIFHVFSSNKSCIHILIYLNLFASQHPCLTVCLFLSVDIQ